MPLKLEGGIPSLSSIFEPDDGPENAVDDDFTTTAETDDETYNSSFPTHFTLKFNQVYQITTVRLTFDSDGSRPLDIRAGTNTEQPWLNDICVTTPGTASESDEAFDEYKCDKKANTISVTINDQASIPDVEVYIMINEIEVYGFTL